MPTDFVSTRPLLDKLGVKPLARVSVIGIKDTSFLTLLRERTPDISNRLRKNSQLIFYEADSEIELQKIESLKGYVTKDGAIWVVSRKGKQAKIRDVQVIVAAKAAGLVDNKVVSFSDSHTALRLVIPKALR